MGQRHKRRKSLTPGEREAFARLCSDLHKNLRPYMIAVDPRSDDYRSALALSDALIKAIKDVTGEQAEWCRDRKAG